MDVLNKLSLQFYIHMQVMLHKKILFCKRSREISFYFFWKLFLCLLIVLFYQTEFGTALKYIMTKLTFNIFPLKRKHCIHAYQSAVQYTCMNNINIFNTCYLRQKEEVRFLSSCHFLKVVDVLVQTDKDDIPFMVHKLIYQIYMHIHFSSKLKACIQETNRRLIIYYTFVKY